MDTLGIAVRNLSTHKVKLTISTERQIEIEYLQGIKQGDDTNIKLQIINDRANVQNDIKLNLTNIRVVTSCGCTKTTTTPERLVDGDSFILGISYDRKEKSNGNFAQSIAFRSNEDNFFIRLKGVRV